LLHGGDGLLGRLLLAVTTEELGHLRRLALLAFGSRFLELPGLADRVLAPRVDHTPLLGSGLLQTFRDVLAEVLLAVVEITEAIVVDDEVFVLAALSYQIGVFLFGHLFVHIFFLLRLPLVGARGAAFSRRS